MLDPFIYLVSGVLKLWHLLLNSVLGLDDSTAWVLALIGLVVTVRGLIAPFSWMQMRTARTSVIMRPELAALNAEYADRTDKESVAEHERRRKELSRRYNHRPAAGCVPMLIQIPVFIGLYRTVLQMARPSENLEVAPDTRIGFLNAEEITAFLNAEIRGIPLPAYLSMPQEMLAQLGTTRDEVRGFILPIVILAVIFTTANLAGSIYRNLETLDWESSLARGTQKMLIGMTVLVPLPAAQPHASSGPSRWRSSSTGSPTTCGPSSRPPSSGWWSAGRCPSTTTTGANTVPPGRRSAVSCGRGARRSGTCDVVKRRARCSRGRSPRSAANCRPSGCSNGRKPPRRRPAARRSPGRRREARSQLTKERLEANRRKRQEKKARSSNQPAEPAASDEPDRGPSATD
ncbi:membrane protein insertase YidC [Corynebacterium suedekumii]|nr:membrane protein insertase YidC [Corynebacterium suedekumii]